MTSIEISKTANKIIKAIKTNLDERKKVAQTHYYADKAVYVYYDSEYDRKAGKYLPYIRVGKNEFKGFATDLEVEQTTREIMTGLNKMKGESRKYKNILYTTREYYNGYSLYNGHKIVEIDKVQLPDNPCKEFKSLQTYLKKYANCTLPDFKLFRVSMGGKRGVLWSEEGDREYLANRPEKCTKVLAELRKYKGAKDNMTYKFGEEDYIDPIDQKYSEYHEVECDGVRRHYVEITIKTPTGKVKYQQKIY